MLVRIWILGLILCAAQGARALAQDAPPPADFSGLAPSPFGSELRVHYYETLRRSPGKALLWELALPGAGNLYTRIYANAAVTAVVSLVGAGLWIAGAAKDDRALWWAGMGTFTAGRTYGLITAPVGAVMLNAAYRRYFGIVLR